MNQSVKPVEVRSQQDLKLLLWQYENNRSITSSWHEAFFGLYILIGMVAVFANGLVVIAVFRNKKVRSKIFYLITSLILINNRFLKFIYSEEATVFLRNLHSRFVPCSNGQIYGADFAKFSSLLRIFEL